MRLAIVGRKNAGKDALADALCRARPFRRTAFADPIKQMLHVGLCISKDVLYGPASVKEQVDPRYGVTVRHMLQTLGTEWGRKYIHDEVWARATMEFIESEDGRPTSRMDKGVTLDWVITDTRFLTEARLAREHGFTLVRVTRPDSSTGAHEDHQSETEQDQIECDVEVVNAGTLEDLDTIARMLVNGVTDTRLVVGY